MSLISSLRALAIGLVVSIGVAAMPGGAAAQGDQRVELAEDASWLDVVNHHRLAAGLAPVVHEPFWLAGLRAHLDYLRLTPDRIRSRPGDEHRDARRAPGS